MWKGILEQVRREGTHKLINDNKVADSLDPDRRFLMKFKFMIQ